MRFLVGLVGILVTLQASGALASSWFGWEKNKGDPKPILGMASPNTNKTTGATPSDAPTPVELDVDDMAIMADILREQTDNVKALGEAVAARHAEVDARQKQADLLMQQQLASELARKPKATVAPSTPNAPQVAVPTAPAIKPYVAPRVPVQEWQAITDAQKQQNPPRGNITIKSPAPPEE